MRRLLISCDLLEPDHTLADPIGLHDELNSFGAVQIQKMAWIVPTEMTVAYMSAKLRPFFGDENRLLFAMISDDTKDIRLYKGVNAIPKIDTAP